MMHRDLKPSNIFFSLDGNIKVGDFGLVTGTAFGALQNSYVTLLSLADRDDHRQHTGNIGSHLYMSPELMSGLKYDQKVDIFSFGIIFFELHYPFSTEMERTKVSGGNTGVTTITNVCLHDKLPMKLVGTDCHAYIMVLSPILLNELPFSYYRCWKI